ncbi:hypothetical protein A0J48_013575 [Sphaerospermopsis aphanizomenoides BCCUSP55]|nr:hypothetical protein [Sphaerospermopsis aphanizomenoides BCCUSP55]
MRHASLSGVTGVQEYGLRHASLSGVQEYGLRHATLSGVTAIIDRTNFL